MGGSVDLSYDPMAREDYIEYIGGRFGFSEAELKRFPFVYVLKCHSATKNELKERHETFFGPLSNPNNPRNWDRFGNWIGESPIPKWAWAATHYHLILYVGSTNNILERLEEHCTGMTFRSDQCYRDEDGDLIGDDDPTMFTKYFPPKDIDRLCKVNNLEKARKKERELAEELRWEGDKFVFSS